MWQCQVLHSKFTILKPIEKKFFKCYLKVKKLTFPMGTSLAPAGINILAK